MQKYKKTVQMLKAVSVKGSVEVQLINNGVNVNVVSQKL